MHDKGVTSSTQPGQLDETGDNLSVHSDKEPLTRTSKSISETAKDIMSNWETHGARLEASMSGHYTPYEMARNLEHLFTAGEDRHFLLDLVQKLDDAGDSLIEACGNAVAPYLKYVKAWYRVRCEKGPVVDSNVHEPPPRRHADDTSSHLGCGPAPDGSTSDSDPSTEVNKEDNSICNSKGQ